MAVRSSELVYGEQLGSGSFGVVFKGKWRYVPVAIKNVRVTRNDYLEDLLQEALLMLELRYKI
jgi:predicted Ser/Thr protein kinase